MTDEIPIWRQAIKDDQHPLHRAAWILFSEEPNLHYADRTLADQKAQVIEFIYQILDTNELFEESSLGGGNAPINGVELLGRWQVVDAIPRLLKIVEEDDPDAIVNGKADTALRQMGGAVFEPLIAFNERTENMFEETIVSIMADACKDDARAYDYIRAIFEQGKDDFDITYMAENLLVCDPKQAIPFLEERLRQRKYSKDLRKQMEGYIAAAKRDDFP